MASQIAQLVVVEDSFWWLNDDQEISSVIPIITQDLTFYLTDDTNVPITSAVFVPQTDSKHTQIPITACVVPAFADDMYNRIWLVPVDASSAYVDFGIIVL